LSPSEEREQRIPPELQGVENSGANGHQAVENIPENRIAVERVFRDSVSSLHSLNPTHEDHDATSLLQNASQNLDDTHPKRIAKIVEHSDVNASLESLGLTLNVESY
jgi:hypothetical protein